MTVSKRQIDKLGERLKAGNTTELDLRELDEYRRSFGEPYQKVAAVIRHHLRLEPTGREAKSTQSVIEKLRRESVRLTQIQDIAGYRIVVPIVSAQDEVASSLRNIFPDVSVIDRRTAPSHGYRALHVVVRVSDKPIEVQVRTELQHQWAELSEKLSDVRDKSIKYGGGDGESRALLDLMSLAVTGHEQMETTIRALPEGGQKATLMTQYNERRARLLEFLARLRTQVGPK
ncbi:MAG: RelA/SpoT domain-containing protein [Acidobacteria bacterium]|nr:RelA/SpoT domain-containing protein [Acidobacteriota bacterium]